MAGELVNRTKSGDAIDNKLLDELNKLKKITKVPRSKLLDEAIELLLEKYKHILEEYDKNNIK